MRPALPIGVFSLLVCPFVAIAQGNVEYVTARGMYRGELGKQLNDYMLDIEKKGFSGALLIERNGECIIASGYGWANREEKTPFTKDTVFDIGSITKQFTAAAIMTLQDAGKLNVQDLLSKYLTKVPTDKQSTTLHHLLTHSSGLKEALGDDYDRMTRDVLIEKALASELLWAPGTKHEYSNAGYALLGAVIEVVSGQPYETYLNEHLFKPAGMPHTGYVIPQWDKDSIARLYRKDASWGTPLDHPWLPDGPGWNLRCNGGILSTLQDLAAWHHALLGDTVLSKASRDLIFTPHVPETASGKSHYGYGWAIIPTARGTRLIAHNGGNGYSFANFRRYVDEDTLLIITSSVSEQSAEKYERGLLEILFPKPK